MKRIQTKKRRKILWHIFPSFFIITILSLTAVAWYATAYFKSFSLKNRENELQIHADFVKREILQNRPDDMDALCKEIGKLTETRITIVLPSGEVVGDSWHNYATMDNHKHRYEIAQALKFGSGIRIRYSDTLAQNMMYWAVKVGEEAPLKPFWIVRVSVSIASIEAEILTIQKNIALALFVALIAAALASLLVARRITRPIELMRTGAQQFADGNLKARLIIPDSKELFQLGITMNQMAQSLDDKIKTIETRSMELEAIYGSMKEAVIAIDLDENIITANHASSAIFNHSPDEIKGRNAIEISRNYHLQQFITRALSHADPLEEDLVIQKDETRIFNVTSTALCNMAGKRLGTLIIFHDMTRIRHLEQMHKDFAANVSHELKTPLTAIKGFVETLRELLDERDGRDGDNAERFLNIIEKNVNRLIALIDDLLALSRLERAEGEAPQLEIFEVSQVVALAVDTCLPLIESSELEIDMECTTHLTAAMDPILMEHALVNLLENAVKYSHAGDKISVRCHAKKRHVVIEVIDSGPGISNEHLSKIFHRFYRVDKGRSRAVGGTGLGLAIVKHIVKYHNGTIGVSSTLGEGSTFKITLPLADFNPNAQQHAPSAQHKGGNESIQINSVPIN